MLPAPMQKPEVTDGPAVSLCQFLPRLEKPKSVLLCGTTKILSQHKTEFSRIEALGVSSGPAMEMCFERAYPDLLPRDGRKDHLCGSPQG